MPMLFRLAVLLYLFLISHGAFAKHARYATGLDKPDDGDYGVTFVSFKKAFFDHEPLPPEYDLRDYGYVSPVRNQGRCGSCWSFSTLDSMESSMLMFGERNVFLSTQHLVQCQFSGCGGGYFAFDFIKKNGITTSDELPYRARNGRCSNDFEKKFKIDSWWRIGPARGTPSMDEVKAALYHFGAISVTVSAGGLGSGGNVTSCRRGGTDHMVTLVGWTDKHGTSGKGTGKWIMKNSWGNWGEKGYAYVGHLCASLSEEAAVSIYKGVPVARMVPSVKLPKRVATRSDTASVTLDAPVYDDASYAWFVDDELRGLDARFTFNPRGKTEVRVVVENEFARVESQSLVGR